MNAPQQKQGSLDEDLSAACSRALELSRGDCRQYAEKFSWQRSTRQFESNLATSDADGLVMPAE